MKKQKAKKNKCNGDEADLGHVGIIVFHVVSGGTEGHKNSGLTASKTKAVIIVPTHHNFKVGVNRSCPSGTRLPPLTFAFTRSPTPTSLPLARLLNSFLSSTSHLTTRGRLLRLAKLEPSSLNPSIALRNYSEIDIIQFPPSRRPKLPRSTCESFPTAGTITITLYSVVLIDAQELLKHMGRPAWLRTATRTAGTSILRRTCYDKL